MSDFWQSLVTAMERVATLPSLVHSVFPSLPAPKRVRERNAPPIPKPSFDRTMDDFLVEVRASFDAPLRTPNLLAVSGKLQEQLRQKLRSSNVCMLPSYHHTLPSGRERGAYLALDVGGSTFRVALVELNGVDAGDRAMRIVRMVTYRIDDAVRELRGVAFFDWMAEKIAETLADPEVRGAAHGDAVLPMGLAWSFAIEQTSMRSGRMVAMGKGFRAMDGLDGQDLADTIIRSCQKKNLNVRMDAIVNDGTATLLSRAYKDSATRLALILGTGTNMAVHLPVTALSPEKFGTRPPSWHDKATHVLVNTEISMFGKNIYPITRWDEQLNRNHSQPDFQPLELLISGRYLGEIVRLVLLEAIQTAGLFGGEVPARFPEPYALDTGTIAVIEAIALARTALLHATHPLSRPYGCTEILLVRTVARLVTRRAAAYLAVGIHALLSVRAAAEGAPPASLADAGRITIGCNGSVIERYPGFAATAQAFLDELVAAPSALSSSGSAEPRSVVVLEPAYESAIFGAAVAAACCSSYSSC